MNTIALNPSNIHTMCQMDKSTNEVPVASVIPVSMRSVWTSHISRRKTDTLVMTKRTPKLRAVSSFG
jgi:hypothetical protein